jgi:hypothetical protein
MRRHSHPRRSGCPWPERILDLDLSRPIALFARDLGESRDLVDQLALRAAHGEGEFGAERQPEDRGRGKRISVAENEPPKMMMTA